MQVSSDGHRVLAIVLTIAFFAGLAWVIRVLTRRAPERNRNPAERNWDLDYNADRFTDLNKPLP